MSGTVYAPADREALIERAAALRNEGLGWTTIGRQLEVPATTIKRWLDHDYNARHLATSRAAKAKRTGRCRGCGATTRYNGHGEPRVSEWCPACRARQNTKWTREAILNAIRAWAAEHNGQPPTAYDWNPTLAYSQGNYMRARAFEHDTRWPYDSTVRGRFGSWNEAIRQAGLQPRQPGSHGPRRGYA